MDMPKASDLHNETLIIKLIKSCKQNLDMVHETLLDAQKQVGSTLILEDLRRINNFLKDIAEIEAEFSKELNMEPDRKSSSGFVPIHLATASGPMEENY